MAERTVTLLEGRHCPSPMLSRLVGHFLGSWGEAGASEQMGMDMGPACPCR